MWTGDHRQVVTTPHHHHQAQAAASSGWVQLLNPNDDWGRKAVNKAESQGF